MSALAFSHFLPRQLSNLWTPAFLNSLRRLHTSLISAGTPAERTFRQLLQYPASSPDPAVFEDLTSGEYLSALESVDSQAGLDRDSGARINSGPWDLSSVLRRLVKEDRFQEAELLFQELKELNFEVRPSIEYAKMARYAVSSAVWPREGESVRDPVIALETWASLIPNRPPLPIVHARIDNKELPRNKEAIRLLRVHELGHFLMRFSRVPARVVVRFALLAAEKGYGRDIHAHITPYLTRHLSCDETAQFLHDFHLAMSQRSVCPPGGMIGRIRRSMWGMAIRAACNSGRRADAQKLLDLAQVHSVMPTRFTLRYLESALKVHGENHSTSDTQTLLPRDSSSHADSPPPEPLTVARRYVLSPRHTLDVNITLAQQILRHGDCHDGILRARPLVPFFTICADKASAPVVVIRRLYAFAWRLGTRSLSILIHAHMLHYIALHRTDSALSLFTRFFHPVGVPVATLYGEGACHGRSGRLVTPDKLYPSPVISAMVWTCLVNRATKREQFLSLYTELKQLAKKDPQALTATHFQHFLLPRRHFQLVPDLRAHALRVYEDMRALGVPPSWRTFITLAQVCVYKGELDDARSFFEEALRVCDAGLAQATSRATDASLTDETRANGRAARIRWTRYRAQVCGLLIRSLLKKGLVNDAHFVANILRKDLEYQRGMDAEVDRALRLLEGVDAWNARKRADEAMMMKAREELGNGSIGVDVREAHEVSTDP
ncbi:hypothetical protein K488DRAFT_89053 [Vararia minispora EC-137]|uniref:Uncharacterized protein n=1 Tax=Vararia minispora EC-137 TaxID=1314806 RepID=A0ACB8QC40_9AGAM|nr:hypothetical protein K488DRAFT_89053 [Vararia minispora EC-137]